MAISENENLKKMSDKTNPYKEMSLKVQQMIDEKIGNLQTSDDFRNLTETLYSKLA